MIRRSVDMLRGPRLGIDLWVPRTRRGMEGECLGDSDAIVKRAASVNGEVEAGDAAPGQADVIGPSVQ